MAGIMVRAAGVEGERVAVPASLATRRTGAVR